MLSLRKYYLKHRFIPVAHRGDSENAPENTLAAYQRAIDTGIPAIEVDVHITKDYHIVAIHDDHLGRTSKTNKQISESTYSELLNIEVGSWFDQKFTGQQIPTLDQVLDLIQNKSYLVLEMKPFSKEPENFVEKVLQTIENHHYMDKSIIVSFDYNLLKIINNINLKVNIAAIKIPNSNLMPSDLQYLTKCEAVICSIFELDENFYNNAKMNNIPIAVYDVDTIELLHKALSYNVQGIGTNYPELIMNYLKEKK